MAAVTVTEVKNRATQVLRSVERGKEYVVTKRGRPIAVILPVDPEALEDWILANHPEAVRRRERARAEIEAGRFVTGAQLRGDLRRLRRRRGG